MHSLADAALKFGVEVDYRDVLFRVTVCLESVETLDAFALSFGLGRLARTFAKQIYLFHEFVFVSTCSVVLRHGAELDQVDEIMRILGKK